jgi:hypothetical protein
VNDAGVYECCKRSFKGKPIEMWYAKEETA